MFNASSLERLIELNREDRDELDLIYECIGSFGEYFRAVITDQAVGIVYGGAADRSDYGARRVGADRIRTACHDRVIMNVGILNKMASEKGIDPVYDGVVSGDRPFRREIADAVFGYLKTVVDRRN
ncbi:MAG: DUF3232 domain-containing protein [Clostridia bacterium]|nr:DUF3232 domain-containing protein [Clostridia bacterium]